MPFADQLRRTIEAAPRTKVGELRRQLYAAFGEGSITEADAEALEALISARQAPSQDPAIATHSGDARRPGEAPGRHRGGSRPRTPESLGRRRRYAAAGRIPLQIAAEFTGGEQAVLSVIVCQVIDRGVCDLHVGHIAALAGVSETTVRVALREAKRLGLVTVQERRMARDRNLSNVVRIVDLAWVAWIRMGGKNRGWVRITAGPDSSLLFNDVETARIQRKGSSEGASRHRQREHANSDEWGSPGRQRTGRAGQP